VLGPVPRGAQKGRDAHHVVDRVEGAKGAKRNTVRIWRGGPDCSRSEIAQLETHVKDRSDEDLGEEKTRRKQGVGSGRGRAKGEQKVPSINGKELEGVFGGNYAGEEWQRGNERDPQWSQNR